MAGVIGYYLYLLAGLVLIAAAIDIRKFQIPNWIPSTIFVTFLFAATFEPGATYWIGHLIAGLAATALGIAAFKYRIMGGGDVKLIAAIAFVIGLPGFPMLLASIGFAGGVLALFIMMARSFSNVFLTQQAAQTAQAILPLLRHDAPAPYGIAIAAGTIITILTI